MKLSKQMYYVDQNDKSESRCIQIQYDPKERPYALNLTGYFGLDHKYGLAKQCIKQHLVIVTDQDLIAHDDYACLLKPGQTVIFLGGNGQYGEFGRASASKKRLRRAQEKLTALGIKTKFFVNYEAMQRYLERIK